MRCSSCHHDNRPGRRFCADCGSALAIACAACGSDNESDDRFCGACGASLVDPLATSETPATRPESHSAADAERRQLTVMFCDLVGSTALSERFDPEELLGIVRAHREICAGVIERFDGYLARYMGDGLLVHFGYPQAHEDDAERAVRAGLAIAEETQQLNARLEREHDIRLAVRIGIHTGLVVAGEMGAGGTREPRGIIGETPNVAARLESIAEPDTVVISGATLRLVSGIFIIQDLGTPNLKGVTEPIRVYRVLQQSGVRSRLELAAGRFTPFVGRQQEADLLRSRWQQVEEKSGQVVFIAGEAGVGKSRLVQVFRTRLSETPHTWLECRCSPYTQGSAFYPVIELLQEAFVLLDSDSPAEKLAKLERGLGRGGSSAPDALPLLASLLSVPLSDRDSTLQMTSDVQRRKTLEALVALLLTRGEQQPIALLFEDVHWSDPSTLELLRLIGERISTTQILLLITSRPDSQLDWPTGSRHTPIMLSQLSRQNAEAMVAELTPERPLPADVAEKIVTRADGIPLFVEELTKMVLESGLVAESDESFESLSDSAIPDTLQDSLMARLDRLNTAKEVAQLGAVLGRDFPYTLLMAVAGLDELVLRRSLERLVEAEVLFQTGAPPQATYSFKHALLQDTAYGSLLRARRLVIHGRVAEALERHFPDRVASNPSLLAEHLDRSGDPRKAFEAYDHAGQEAAERAAFAEAERLFRRALTLVEDLPDDRERARWDLSVQLELAAVLHQAKGSTNESVVAAYDRALELARSLGDSDALVRALHGLAAGTADRGEHRAQIRLSEQMLEAARTSNEPSHRAIAHGMICNSRLYLGEFRKSLEASELAFSSGDQLPMIGIQTFGDFPVWTRSLSAFAAWSLGHPSRCLALSELAVERAIKGAHPLTITAAYAYRSLAHMLRREPRETREWAEAAVAIARENEFAQWLGIAGACHAWAGVYLGEGADCLTAFRESLSARASTGYRVGAPLMIAMLAEMELYLGNHRDASAIVQAALDISVATEQPLYDADLYRLMGEVYVELPDRTDAEAEALFRKAIKLAQDQEAKSLELRAATSLARLLRRHGKDNEARTLLQCVYDWFSEGLDTPDLKDAKSLIEACK